MVNDELLRALGAVSPAHWTTSGSDADAVEWLPLTQISGTGIWVGLDRNGEWIVGRLAEKVATSSGGPAQPWVTMLDMDESEFRSNLSRASDNYHLPSMLLQEMAPINDILAMAIESGSKHWADRAVSWLSKRQIKASDIPLLNVVVDAKWVSQQTRHTARRLIKIHTEESGA